MDYDDLPTFEPIHRKKHPKASSKKRRRAGHLCLHKKRYHTNGEAMRAFANQIATIPHLRIYHCPDCHGWHLTHKPQISTP